MGSRERQAPLTRALPALWFVAALSSVVVWPARSGAGPSLDDVVGRAVRRNYGAIHGCYRKVLAEDRARGGTLFVRVVLGGLDAVKSVAVARDELGHAGATRCILGWMRGWTLHGAAAAGARRGSEITIPLTFRGAPEQFVVRREDAPEVSLGPGGTAQPLLHAGSVGGRAGSLTVLSFRGKLTLPAVAADQALVVLSGRARLGRRALARGRAAWIPPRHVASVRGAAEVLLFTVPGGPARRLLAGAAHQGGVPPVRDKVKLVVGPRRLDARRMGHRRFRLAVERLPARAWARRVAPGTTELLYLVRGDGTATSAGTSSASAGTSVGTSAVSGGKQVEPLSEGSAAYLRGGAEVRGRGKAYLVRVTVPAPEGHPGRR